MIGQLFRLATAEKSFGCESAESARSAIKHPSEFSRIRTNKAPAQPDIGQYWSIICCHLARGERPESWIISIGCEGGSSRRARSDLLRLSKLKRSRPVPRKSHSPIRDAV